VEILSNSSFLQEKTIKDNRINGINFITKKINQDKNRLSILKNNYN
jgi:hypothetical protein